MAKVSQAHLDARRRQILDAARACFARDGFHAASMQDVITEAGLSAGAVYRYFASKEEIVAAVATETMAEVARAIADAARIEPPLPLDEVFANAFETLERQDDEYGIASLAVQVWGEAVRSPVVAERVTAAAREIHASLAAVVARHQSLGTIDPEVPTAQVATVLRGLLPGFLAQRAVLGEVDAEGFRAGMRAIICAERPPR
jgi:TetR/AcrR family transcriptional regulator, transcriptional repressor of aconitase